VQTDGPQNVFAGAWAIVRANPILYVPSLVLGLLGGVGAWFASPTLAADGGVAALGGSLIARFVWWFISVAVAVVAMTVTVGMAEAAWEGRKPQLGDGFRAVRFEAFAATATLLILLAIGACAALLAPVTLFVSLVAFAFLTPYALPAAIVGGVEPFRAVNESFNLAWNHPVNTAVMLVGVAFVWLLGLLLAGLLDVVPFLGPVLGALVDAAVIAYATVVYVGEYIALRGPRSPKRSLD
jgi:hypothetical protein